MTSLKLTREADLAAEWGISLEQIRLLRRRQGWPHVEFSRQDIRYTDAQIEQIVRDRTKQPAARPTASPLTSRSARRAS